LDKIFRFLDHSNEKFNNIFGNYIIEPEPF